MLRQHPRLIFGDNVVTHTGPGNAAAENSPAVCGDGNQDACIVKQSISGSVAASQGEAVEGTGDHPQRVDGKQAQTSPYQGWLWQNKSAYEEQRA